MNTISKKTPITIGLMLVLIGVIITIVVTATNHEDRIEVVEREQTEYPNIIKNINNKLNDHDIKIEVIDTKLDIIIEDLKEIKEELKGK